MNHHIHTISNGIIGVTASVCGMLTTFQQQLEWGVRMAGGILGIAVGIVTLYNLLRKR